MSQLRIPGYSVKKDVLPGPGVKMKTVHVKGHLTPDKGAKGRNPITAKPFDPAHHSGFKKEHSPMQNANLAYSNARPDDKKGTLYQKKLRTAIRMMGQLARVSTDGATKRNAEATQKVLSMRLAGTKRMKN